MLESRNEGMRKIGVAIIIIACLLLAGCIYPEENVIIKVNLSIDSYSEPLNNNSYEDVLKYFDNNCSSFSPRNDTDFNGTGFTAKHCTLENDTMGYFISVYVHSWSLKDTFSLSFKPNSKYNGLGKEDVLKGHMKDVSIDIADICNITLDWDYASWTVITVY